MNTTFSNYPEEMYELTEDQISRLFQEIAVSGIHLPDAITIRCGDMRRAKEAIFKMMGMQEEKSKAFSEVTYFKGLPVLQDQRVLPSEMIVTDRWGKVWMRFSV